MTLRWAGFFFERRDFSGLELVAPALGIIHGLKPIFSSRPLIVGEMSSGGSFLMYSITNYALQRSLLTKVVDWNVGSLLTYKHNTDRNNFEDSYGLVKHFPDFTLW